MAALTSCTSRLALEAGTIVTRVVQTGVVPTGAVPPLVVPPRFVLGVDGGGTKTHAVVASADGEVLGTGAAGGSNWEVIGLDAMVAAIAEAVGAALNAAVADGQQLAASCFALAGCDWPSDVTRIDAALMTLSIGGRRTVVNDAYAALRAGTLDAHGIASVAGTGGSTTGRNRAGEQFRTFAISMGEGSGASGIVNEAVRAIARAHHGQIPATLLADRFTAALQFASVAAMFESMSRGRWPWPTAALAVLVTESALDGDGSAIEVMTSVGAQHGADVVGVARKLRMLDDEFDVVTSGGVHRAQSSLFNAAFRKRVLTDVPNARFVTPESPPVAGAVLLAIECLGADSAAARGAVDRGIAMAEIR